MMMSDDDRDTMIPLTPDVLDELVEPVTGWAEEEGEEEEEEEGEEGTI